MIPSIAVALIIRRGNKVIWVRRDDGTKEQAGHSFPRGVVKPYERLMAAGARIAKEQTGLTVDVTQSLYTQETIDEVNFAHEVVLYLGCNYIGGFLQADSDRVQWVTANMLKHSNTLTDAAKDAVTALFR